MEKIARISFIALTLFALSTSALYHNFLAPPKTELSVSGYAPVVRDAHEIEYKERFGTKEVGWATYAVQKFKEYRRLGKLRDLLKGQKSQ
jgi:hypothetical protein